MYIGRRLLREIDNLMIKKKESDKDKRIKELEDELRREKLRADLWQKMVNIAEDEFNIDIIKKSGAK